MKFAKSVNILGTKYRIKYLDYEDEPAFENDVVGLCSKYTRTISVGNLSTFSDYKNESKKYKRELEKETLRHEIVHAFYYESGLACNSNTYSGAWAINEEMVDWIAKQGLKLYNAWLEAGAI
ncbi:MAG: hypothetical protein ACI4F7_08885 [Acutalibacteraceae bacterium]